MVNKYHEPSSSLMESDTQRQVRVGKRRPQEPKIIERNLNKLQGAGFRDESKGIALHSGSSFGGAKNTHNAFQRRGAHLKRQLK